MFEFAEFVVAGLFLGATYGLLAIPNSILFVATGKVDLAIGAYAVLAAAVCWSVGGAAGIVLGILAACLASAIVGIISAMLDRRPHGDPLVAVLASFGASVFIESFLLTVFGKDPFRLQAFDNFVSFAGFRFSPQSPLNAAIALLVIAGLYALIYRTSWGRDMRACAANPLGAAFAGIAASSMQFLAFLISGLLAGAAGILVLYSTGVEFSAGLHLTLVGIGAAILFGLHSPIRGFFGGLAIGVLEAIGGGYFNGFLASALPIIVIFIVLSLGRSSLEQIRGGRA